MTHEDGVMQSRVAEVRRDTLETRILNFYGSGTGINTNPRSIGGSLRCVAE